MQTLLLVSHTHWDREWYLTFEEYRTRLVAVYDAVLDVLEHVPEFHSFAFDGQTVPVDDYLEIRPEAFERVRAQVRAGRLFVGPLYVIPDGYAPTGEAWVRNLLLGLARCAELGRDPGYVYVAEPTSLPEQYPQIIRRFGFDSVIFGRGLHIDQRDGPEGRVEESEYFWEAPEGSRLLVVHMPAAYTDHTGSRCILHYCNAAEVFWSPEYDPLREQERTITAQTPNAALERIRILREYLTPRATSHTILLMHGCDHLPPQPDTPELIGILNERLEGARLVHGSFSDYLDAVKRAGRAKVVRRGESRARGGAMSRVYLRRLNADTLMLLEHRMEPFAALSWLLGGPADQGLARQAWRYMLQNHAHDTIWGCSVDAVYDEVRVRFAKSRQIAEEVAGRALDYVAGKINTNSLPGDAQAVPYVAFAASGWGQAEAAEVELWLPPETRGSHLSVTDDSGKRWLAQVLHSRSAVRRTERFGRVARVEPVRAVRALVRAESLPAMGYRAVAVAATDEPQTSDLATGPMWLENECVRVEVHPDGSFDLTDRATGRVTRGLNRLEDQGDAGHGWRFQRIERDRFVSASDQPGTIRLIERGPVRASLEVRVPWKLPEGLTADGKTRLRRTRLCPLTVRISLLARSRRVEVRTVLDNRVRNHRLRAFFSTGIRTEATQADGAFAVHERPIYLTDMRPHTQPSGIGLHPSTPEEVAMMHSFADVSDGRCGLALLTKGVPQYEVQKDQEGAAVLVLILMRAVLGHTHSHDPDLTHGAQCFGEQAAEYAILPHAGDWLAGEVHREAESYLAPPCMVRTTRHDGAFATTSAWMEPLPPEIMLTATKRSEDGRSIVVRLVNLVRQAREAMVTFTRKPKAVSRANLREECEEVLVVLPSGGVCVRFAPMEIVTLRLDWER